MLLTVAEQHKLVMKSQQIHTWVIEAMYNVVELIQFFHLTQVLSEKTCMQGVSEQNSKHLCGKCNQTL